MPVILIDTAGIRRKSSSRDQIERYSLMRGIHAMERADTVLLRDRRIGRRAGPGPACGGLRAGGGEGPCSSSSTRSTWCAPAERKPAHWRTVLARQLQVRPLRAAGPVSAKTKEGIGQDHPAALEVVGQRRIKMAPNELNRVLREAFLQHPPPSFKGRRLKLGYATQAGSEAPTVVMFVNDTGLLHFSYRRYLENKIRERFGLIGNPLKLVLRSDDRTQGTRRTQTAGPRRAQKGARA